MATERTDDPRGILNPQTLAKYVALKRFIPNARLAPYVEHYWQVQWDLPPGISYTSETVPHPSVHLVIEPVAMLDAEQEVDLAGLAMELGYTDQAHFTNDFRAMTGRTPGHYPE